MRFKWFLQDNLRSGVFLRNQQRLICRRPRCCVLHSHRKRNACLNMCVLPCLSDLLSELAWCLFFTAGTRRITLILGSMSSMMNNSRWAFTVVLQFPISKSVSQFLENALGGESQKFTEPYHQLNFFFSILQLKQTF